MYTYLPSLERIVLELKAGCKCNKERGLFIGNTSYANQMKQDVPSLSVRT